MRAAQDLLEHLAGDALNLGGLVHAASITAAPALQMARSMPVLHPRGRCGSVRSFASFIAALLPVLRGGTAVDARLHAVAGRGPAIICGRPSGRASRLGLILGERIADRGAYITAGRLAIARLRGAVTVIRAAIGFVAVVGLWHDLRVDRSGPAVERQTRKVAVRYGRAL